MAVGCSTTDYEALYNDDAKIAGSTSNVRVASLENSTKGNYKFSCASLNGVFVAVNTFSVSDETSANLTFGVAEGKGKVVLVKDKTVYTVAEGSFDGALDLSGIPEGRYQLKIAGVGAKIELTLKY